MTFLLMVGLAVATMAPAAVRSFAQAVAAAPNPASVPSKIAFVSLQDAVVGCEEGKQTAAALQQRFKEKQEQLKAQDDELKQLKDNLQTTGDKLNEEERLARAKVIQDKQKAFERSYSDYQSETQEAQQAAIGVIVKKMLPVLEKYVTDNGYTAVFDISSPQAPVLWVRKSSMLTQQLINAYNAKYPVTTPTPPEAPAAHPVAPAPSPTPQPK